MPRKRIGARSRRISGRNMSAYLRRIKARHRRSLRKRSYRSGGFRKKR